MESCKVDLYSLESRRNPVMSVTIQIEPRLFHYFNIVVFFFFFFQHYRNLELLSTFDFDHFYK